VDEAFLVGHFAADKGHDRHKEDELEDSLPECRGKNIGDKRHENRPTG